MRYERLDALRGLAIVWMALFHFAFDLAHFKLIDANFYRDPFWLHQRTAILSLFLFCAGLGQAVATAQHQPWPRFWRRWAQVAGAAMLVSAGSALMFGPRFIHFGVLHGIAVMLILTRLTARWGRWLWLAGAVAVIVPWLWRDPLFNARWLDWTGLMTRKPRSEDHVPLLPWLGVMWWGLATGRWLLAHRAAWLQGPLPPRLGGLARLGRWSLSLYLLHQPLLIGLISAGLWLAR